jgi:hypothetical protein
LELFREVKNSPRFRGLPWRGVPWRGVAVLCNPGSHQLTIQQQQLTGQLLHTGLQADQYARVEYECWNLDWKVC